MLKLVTAPNNVLSKKVEEYPLKKNLPAARLPDGQGRQEDTYLIKFLKEMEKALLMADDPKGVGLAAPQIGKSIAIFMAKPSEKDKTEIFINPKIIKAYSRSNRKKTDDDYRKLEGCLSLPTIWGEVKREEIVVLDWVDEKGNRHSKKFSGFISTIIQHEMDHLDGILFPKRVLEQKGRLFKSHKEKGKDVFEELSV